MATPEPIPCGLYRTTTPLPGSEEKVLAERLIFYHNHSQQGPPLVLTPHANEHNVWEFHERGFLAHDLAWSATLVALRPEGYYVLDKHLHLGQDEEVLPEKTLVQLGYGRKGSPILFPSRFRGNAILFSDKGYGFDDRVFAALKPTEFLFPRPTDRETVH